MRLYGTKCRCRAVLSTVGKKSRGGLDQPLRFPAQPAKDARLGDEDGVHRNPQLGRDDVRPDALQGHAIERFPRGEGEMGFDQRQQLSKDMLVVLTVPDLAYSAGLVLKLFQPAFKVRVASRLRAPPPRAPEIAESVDQDGPEPGTESAGLSAVLETLQVTGDGQQHFLHEVVRVARLHVVLPKPRCQQWCVKAHQPVPGLAVGRLVDPNKQTE